MRDLNHQPPSTQPKWHSPLFTMDLGTWYHVAVTVSRSTPTRTITFYVNGTTVGTVADPDIPTGKLLGSGPGFPKMDIGHAFPSADWKSWGLPYQYLFGGHLDEIEIFKRALEATEIQKIYLASKYGKCRNRCKSAIGDSFCIDETEKTINVTIWNESEDDLNNRLHLHLGGTQATGNCNFDLASPLPTTRISTPIVTLFLSSESTRMSMWRSKSLVQRGSVPVMLPATRFRYRISSRGDIHMQRHDKGNLGLVPRAHSRARAYNSL